MSLNIHESGHNANIYQVSCLFAVGYPDMIL